MESNTQQFPKSIGFTKKMVKIVIRPDIFILPKSWPAFQVCGYTGLALAILLAMTLAINAGISPWVMVVIILASVATFFALVMLTKIITGEERIISYHHIITVTAVSALILEMLSQPILPYLDVTILGVGLFIACGRVGCLIVGCCHGRPCRWGVCYGQAHVVAGFTSYLKGVRLFPIQGVESLWILFIVIVGAGLILNIQQSGEALAWYVIAYGLGRFSFEFARGDADRPYYGGFSQPQWIAVILMICVGWAEWVDILPLHAWHIAVTGGLILAMVIIALKRRLQKTKKHLLRHPRHVKEIAEAIQMASHPAAMGAKPKTHNAVTQNIQVACTSMDIQISASRIDDGNIHHFALSSPNGMMTEKSAEIVADLIWKLKYASDSINLTQGNQGVFHLLIRPRNQSNRQAATGVKNMRELPIYKPELRQEMVNGLLYTHTRLNVNTGQTLVATSQLTALVELLSEKGVITSEELEKRTETVGKKLFTEFQEKGMGVALYDPAPDKYAFKNDAKIDCASRIHLCQAACCRLTFALSKQDVMEGVVRWELGKPYMIARNSDGYCGHLDRQCMGCSVYEHRPVICRTYDCRNDKRIWLDFEKKISNPDITRPGWPYLDNPEAESRINNA
jgi:prolipoprotein diacylglyceryltransferase/Fe-S-cluster containining protein